jgi:hypothetical protein
MTKLDARVVVALLKLVVALFDAVLDLSGTLADLFGILRFGVLRVTVVRPSGPGL